MIENGTMEGFPHHTLRDFYTVLFRHKWKAVVFFLIVMAAVASLNALMPEIYRAEAKLLIRIGRESVSLDPTAATGQILSIGQTRESEINSELEILESQELSRKVVDALGPEVFLNPKAGHLPNRKNIHPIVAQARESLRAAGKKFKDLLRRFNLISSLTPQEKALVTFSENLKIEVKKNSNIISMAYESEDPQVGQQVLSKLIDFYLEKHIATHRTAGSYEFFAQQTNRFENQLATAQDSLQELKKKTGIASFEDQRKAALGRIGDLQKNMEDTESAIAIADAKVQSLQKDLANLPPTQITQKTSGTGNYAADLMRSRLYELQIKEQDLASKYTDSNVLVLEIRRQIAEARALLAKEEPSRTQVTSGINTTYEQLKLALITEMSGLSSMQARRNVLKGQMESAQKELVDLNEAELRLANLQREIGLKEANYRKYSENLEQARIDQALETKKISNVRLVQKSTALVVPIRPRKLVNLALGLVLGILGGIIVAFFSDYLDDSIRTPEDVESKLHLPLLASIPSMRGEEKSCLPEMRGLLPR